MATHTGTPSCGSFLLHGPLPAPLGSVGSSTSSGSEYNWVGRLRYFQDTELDLYWFGRPYDPITSQFISEDRIGYADDPNLYRYCRNNPVNNVDPSGTQGEGTSRKSAAELLLGSWRNNPNPRNPFDVIPQATVAPAPQQADEPRTCPYEIPASKLPLLRSQTTCYSPPQQPIVVGPIDWSAVWRDTLALGRGLRRAPKVLVREFSYTIWDIGGNLIELDVFFTNALRQELGWKPLFQYQHNNLSAAFRGHEEAVRNDEEGAYIAWFLLNWNTAGIPNLKATAETHGILSEEFGESLGTTGLGFALPYLGKGAIRVVPYVWKVVGPTVRSGGQVLASTGQGAWRFSGSWIGNWFKLNPRWNPFNYRPGGVNAFPAVSLQYVGPRGAVIVLGELRNGQRTWRIQGSNTIYNSLQEAIADAGIPPKTGPKVISSKAASADPGPTEPPATPPEASPVPEAGVAETGKGVQLLHTEASFSKASLDFWRKFSPEKIIESLRTGQIPGSKNVGKLEYSPDGKTLYNGNTRVKVLQEKLGLSTQQVVDIIEGKAPLPKPGTPGPGTAPSGKTAFEALFGPEDSPSNPPPDAGK